MRDGFVKVAAANCTVNVCDVDSNVETITKTIKEAGKNGAKVIVLPELCISGYSCRDIFFQSTLLDACQRGLCQIAEDTKDMDALIVVGLPFEYNGKLYNVAAVLNHGEILGLVPKKNLPNYQEFYERRQFTPGFDRVVPVTVAGQESLMGADMLFNCKEMPHLVLGVEICEDLWVPCPPSTDLALAGATLIANPSASDEITGKNTYRKELVSNQSARLYCGYIYASATDSESTTDVVYSGHNIIAESGSVLAESELFSNGIIYSEIDVEAIIQKRMRMTTYNMNNDSMFPVDFSLNIEDCAITRYIDPLPFVPSEDVKRTKRCEDILDIQCRGLKKRLSHTGIKSAVIGISGGLDSTLALLVTVRAFDMLGFDRKGIIGVTMPGFGTTDRTYDNAVSMIKTLGITFKEISIVDAVKGHFADIEHDINIHDVTYENSQARSRTLILMDLANKYNGLVIGTGDMSELALGWATYNGDHMSMYAVNAGVPKTLVRHLVAYYAEKFSDTADLKRVLLDVLDTPVSPELLPPDQGGKIAQKTEDLVGPYELHDFFLYHFMRYGERPAKTFRLALIAFEDKYDRATILKWLKTFYRRFFYQQYKRSCLPDGPKVGSVCLSPRGDLRMVSDTNVKLWLQELENFS